MGNRSVQTRFIQKRLSDTSVVWNQETNQYYLMKEPVYDIFNLRNEGGAIEDIASVITEKYDLSKLQVNELVMGTIEVLNCNKTKINHEPNNKKLDIDGEDVKFYSQRFYHFNNLKFSISYGSQFLEDEVHKPFLHLEISEGICDNNFELFEYDDLLILKESDDVKGVFNKTETHLLKGRFYMQLLNKFYGLEEDNWMSVLHSASVCNGRKCILFPGNSGVGKSMLSSILLTQGYHIYSDDFTPIEPNNGNGLVRFFPAAISVKQAGAGILLPYLSSFGDNGKLKIWDDGRNGFYLGQSLKNRTVLKGLPVHAIVFVKHDNNVEFEFQRIELDRVFERIIPDSWISQKPQNVECFLEWISTIPCYSLTYRSNQKMISQVTKLFHEL